MRKPVDQRATDNCFKRVAHAERHRGRQIAGRRGVHEKRRYKDSRPDARAEEQKCGQRNARRWPDGRDARVDKGNPEPEFAGRDVHGGQRGAHRDVSGDAAPRRLSNALDLRERLRLRERER